MPWIKQNLIFNLDPNPFRTTHAQVPTPYVMDDRIRVFYAARTSKNISYITYFDLSKDLKTVITDYGTPVMERGNPGMFDADGVMPSCVIKNGDELWMYYIGWNELKNTARYQNEIGIAVSKDGGDSFRRMYEGPIIGRSPTEPGLAVMPFVMYKNYFRMWYQSLTEWVEVDGKYEPVYVIKYAESVGGVEWDRHPEQCVKEREYQTAYSRPSVILENGKFLMWYCSRGSEDYRGGKGSYLIHHAESDDGVRFAHQPCGLYTGDEGDWDSEMQCYPYVLEVDGKRVMLYNGNGFGQTGVGLAIWKN